MSLGVLATQFSLHFIVFFPPFYIFRYFYGSRAVLNTAISVSVFPALGYTILIPTQTKLLEEGHILS